MMTLRFGMDFSVFTTAPIGETMVTCGETNVKCERVRLGGREARGQGGWQ